MVMAKPLQNRSCPPVSPAKLAQGEHLFRQVPAADRQEAKKKVRVRYLDPVEYAAKVLHVKLAPFQEKAASLIVQPPYKVLVRSANNVGKSFLAGLLVNWFFDTFDPGFVLTTAPTDRQVKGIMWKEVRQLRHRAKIFDPDYDLCLAPRDPRLETHDKHFAYGFTARDASSFQGYHGAATLIIFDEAQAVDGQFWEATEPMLGGHRFAFLGIYNPTDSKGRVVLEESAPGYHPVVQVSALDHPNIVAELEGRKPELDFANAIHLDRFRSQCEKWCDEISEQEAGPEDFCLDETKIGGPKRWFRPGMAAEARLLGRWSKLAEDSVWSQFTFDQCMSERAKLMDTDGPLQIGCDVARFGRNDTSWHVRKGGVSLYHEVKNGWNTERVAARCMDLAAWWGNKFNINPKSVAVVIDSCGVGGGVEDKGVVDGWAFIGVNAQECPAALKEGKEYPNVRSALWFSVAEGARQGFVSLAKLPSEEVQRLRSELMVPRYNMDNRGRRVVESKEEIKKRLKGAKSPDSADAFNLAHLNVGAIIGGERYVGNVGAPG